MACDSKEKKIHTKQFKKAISEKNKKLAPSRRKLLKKVAAQMNLERSLKDGIFYTHKGERNSEGLTDKQHRFVEEYLVDMDKRRAEEAVNLRPYTGNSLLKKPHIQEAIRVRKQKISEKMEMDRQEIIELFSSLARAQMTDYLEYDEAGNVRFKNMEDLNEGQKAAIAEVTFLTDRNTGRKSITRIRLHDSIRAAELLSKYHGLFEKDNKQKATNVQFNIDDLISEIEKTSPALGEIVRAKLSTKLMGRDGDLQQPSKLLN